MTDTNTLAPTDEELMALSHECSRMPGGLGMHYRNYARAVLEKWGTPAPAIQPVANDNREMLDQWERDGELKARAWGAMLEQEQEIVRLEKELQALKTQPAGLPTRMLKPAAWAATNAEGIVEALGMNQSRRFDTPLHTVAQVQAMLSAGLAPGWQAVPVEPTEEQLAAVRQKPHPTNPNGWDVNHRRIYQAMLAAAPSRPAREPLTDEQIQEIISKLDPLFLDTPQGFETDFARVIERAHGITAAQNGDDHG